MSLSAILLCAGQGTRIRDVTDQPKCLLEVAGKPIIQHQLDAIEQAGITHTIVVIGYRSQALREIAPCLRYNGALQFVENAEPARLGNSFSLLLGLRKALQDVIVFDGDLVFEPEILTEFSKTKSDAFVVGPGQLDDLECAKALCDGDGFLRLLIDKRAVSENELANFKFLGEAIGIFSLSSQTRERLIAISQDFLDSPENLKKNWEELFNQFFVTEQISYHLTPSRRWVEIDDAADLKKAKSIF